MMNDEFVLEIIAMQKVGLVEDRWEEGTIGKGGGETGRCVAVQYSSTRGVEMILSACRNCRGMGVF